MMDPTVQLRQWVSESQKIVVLSGAGMSTASGIPDFRSDTGVWQDDGLMEAMSEQYFDRHPLEFWPKFKQVFMNPEYLRARPNAGHVALRTLEANGKDVQIFTQNVDGLHQSAGSRHVYELHGSVKLAECPVCRCQYGVDHILSESVPRCTWVNAKGGVCNFILQPDTVLFGQSVRHLHRAMAAISECDLLLVLGTSLTVHPVADLPSYIDASRAKMVIINYEETYLDAMAHLSLRADIAQVLPQIVV